MKKTSQNALKKFSKTLQAVEKQSVRKQGVFFLSIFILSIVFGVSVAGSVAYVAKYQVMRHHDRLVQKERESMDNLLESFDTTEMLFTTVTQ